ncbi:MAG TPA: hypothetical protein VGO91_01565 [Pyrinomonadaceae bacterium]|nr:hypothetical protein [Pyrinomonadaceae bacterium]
MRKIDLRAILKPVNRLVLLDVVVFVHNLILMILLSRMLANLAQQAQQGVLTAKAEMALFCLALCMLSPIGAILKRRRAHLRNPDIEPVAGFLFVLYFLTQLMFLICASTLLVEAGGTDYQGPAGLFAHLFFGLPALAVLNTLIVYFYFLSPKHKPLFKLLLSPVTEIAGDACVFLNVILFQMLWWYLLADPYFSDGVHGVGEFIAKTCAFAGLALFIYVPPRIFYFAEDVEPKTILLTMLLANLPVLWRVFFGTGLNMMTN